MQRLLLALLLCGWAYGQGPVTIVFTDSSQDVIFAGDNANNALRVNCVTGCSSDGGGGDVCATQSRSAYVVSLTSSTKIISGSSGKQTYICYLQISLNATANNIALVEGTGSTCASSTAGMSGGSTAATGWNLLASGSVTAGGITAWAFKTATTGDDVCFLVSSGAQLSGIVQYVQQ